LTVAHFLDYWLEVDVKPNRAPGTSNSALRQGELFGLQWRDVDFTEKRVRVRHSLEELDGKLRLREPKSDKSRRTVDLPASAAEALAGHRSGCSPKGITKNRWPPRKNLRGGHLCRVPPVGLEPTTR
jgi:integrase